MPRVRSLLICVLMSVPACGGRLHTEIVGQGTAIVQPRTEVASLASASNPSAPWEVGSGITLPRGSYDLALWFDLPRAQVVDWTVTCPGVEISGRAGEAFEQYRARRLAELRAQRDRDRRQVAALTSAVVGGVGPRVHGYGHVTTPAGDTVVVEGEAQLPAGAIGAAVAAHAIEDVAELPPGDVGRGRLAHTVRVETKGDGVCAVVATADDPSVMGSYQVTRIRDLDAEARLRVMARNSAAMTVRGRLQTRFVALGADPTLLERQRAAAAEARLRVEADARARVEARLEVEAQAEAELRAVAWEARTALRGRCVARGADPERRHRIALQEQAMSEQHRVQAEAQARLGLDVEQRRLDLALHARHDLRTRLVALGAIPRPPMPAPLIEEPGELPFPGARWTSGKWVWSNGRWEWRAGYWSDPTQFDVTGGDVLIGVGAGVGLGLDMFEPIRDDRVRDHRDRDANVFDHRRDDNANVRDHRRDRDTNVRDHRDLGRDTNVRDHRRDGDTNVRDHRDRDDKKDDDRGTNVRDHRRR